LNHLGDEIPECRAAAAETLGKTSRDVAFTHISHLLTKEKDEKVIRTMRQALVDIRKNMRAEHAENR
jgi:Mg/Co/Ni transporter MgtE